MKKLLLITDMFPDNDNHVSGIFVKHQVDELAKKFDVFVIATAISDKFNIVEIDFPVYKTVYISFPIIKRFFLSSLVSYRFLVIPQISNVIIKWEPDIIHVHDCRHIPELVSLNYFFRRIQIPKFLSLHNVRTHPNNIKNHVLKYIYQFSLKKAFTNWTHIFTVNDNLKQMISKFNPYLKITNIGNAIGPMPTIANPLPSAFSFNNHPCKFSFISVGNLVKEKGFDLLIEASSALIKKYDFQLIIVGDGKERDFLEKQVIKFGLTNVVFLLGRLDNDIVRNLYQDFDAFVLPSYRETFGIVYLEAMYAGLPVIGVKGQGIDGVIKHKETGLLVNPQDVKDLSDNMEFIINNQNLSQDMADKGRQLVKQKYMLSDLIYRVEQFYEA